MSFLRDKKLYVGLDFDNIRNINSTCDNCKVKIISFDIQ